MPSTPPSVPERSTEDAESGLLVARVKMGERAAFGDLYARYFDPVYAYMQVALREDEHRAEDATQQVFMKALEALPHYENRKQPLRAWLFTIARHQALDELAERARLIPTEPDDLPAQHQPGPAVGPDWISDADVLMLTSRLPVAQRQVLLLRYLGDLTHEEVAEVLGQSTVSVRALQSRALHFLRERLHAIAARGAHGRVRCEQMQRLPSDRRVTDARRRVLAAW